MLERALMKKSLAYLNKLPGAFFFKVHGSPYQIGGIPDLIGLYKGRFVGIELKVNENLPTSRQVWFSKQIQIAGGYSAVCWDIDDVKEFIENIKFTRETKPV